MFDPVVPHLHHARQTAEWIAQIIRLDPDLGLPAAMPLIAARLMGAGGSMLTDEETEGCEAAEDGDEEAFGI